MTVRKTVTQVDASLKIHEAQCAERWKTAFNNFAEIKEEIENINSTLKTATFGMFGFIGALAIAILTAILL
tara:strand:+ start:930 stop:1142 length:213 start_codon:yes stop_codon:yes gene_type:complete